MCLIPIRFCFPSSFGHVYGTRDAAPPWSGLSTTRSCPVVVAASALTALPTAAVAAGGGPRTLPGRTTRNRQCRSLRLGNTTWMNRYSDRWPQSEWVALAVVLVERHCEVVVLVAFPLDCVIYTLGTKVDGFCGWDCKHAKRAPI